MYGTSKSQQREKKLYIFGRNGHISAIDHRQKSKRIKNHQRLMMFIELTNEHTHEKVYKFIKPLS